MAAPVQTRDQYLDLLSKPLEVPWADRFRAVQLQLNVEVSPRYTPDQRLEKGEVILALQEAQRAGKTRFIGYSGDNEGAHHRIVARHAGVAARSSGSAGTR